MGWRDRRRVGPVPPATGALPADRPWLMVFRAGSSELLPLPDEGEAILGAGPLATVLLQDPGLLPVHATLRLGAADVVLLPAADAPLLLNDEPLAEPRALASGDSITLGSISLVFHDRPGRGTRRALLDPGPFRTRLRQEVERCLRSRGSLAVIVVRLGRAAPGDLVAAVEAVGASLRQVDVISWDGAAEIAVILPETAEAAVLPTRRALEAALPHVPGVRAGYSLCPTDAHDVDGLLTGARNAASTAVTGDVAAVSSVIVRYAVGERPLLAADPAMRRLLELVERLAASDLPVLVEGETGVGKEMVALALHEWSARQGRPFLAINCAAVAETLFESELFGHERGAFTGAATTKKGLLEAAQGGTVLLDEIGECPPHVQPKLLRVLETRRVARVGAVVERPVDVRIVAATNRDLEGDVLSGRFRRDLYYRLASARLTVPPLRDRPLDVPVLARDFLEAAFAAKGRNTPSISTDAMRRLVLHDWPGNVREVKNLMDFCAATMDGDILLPQHIPVEVARNAAPWLAGDPQGALGAALSGGGFEPFERRRHMRLADEVRELQRTRILQALTATDGVRVEAARLLSMPLRTLVTRLSEFGINPPGRGSGPGKDLDP